MTEHTWTTRASAHRRRGAGGAEQLGVSLPQHGLRRARPLAALTVAISILASSGPAGAAEPTGPTTPDPSAAEPAAAAPFADQSEQAEPSEPSEPSESDTASVPGEETVPGEARGSTPDGASEAAPPTAPDDPIAAREQTRQEQTALATDLDVLEASEAELDAAAEALASEVRTQRVDVASSRRAVDAAAEEVERTKAALGAARREIDVLTAQLVDRAVDSFISPDQTLLYDIASSEDIGEAVRMQAFISQLLSDEAALVDELEAARLDLEDERAAADVAERTAEERRVENEDRLVDLEAAIEEHARVQAAIEERQADVLAEIEALAATEAELTAAIEQAEREQREREERARVEAAERERALAEQRARDEAARVEAERQEAARLEAERQAAAAAGASTVAPPAPATTGPAAPPSTQRSAPAPTPAPSPSSGAQPGAGGCIWPTRGTVTSEFGSRWGRLHAGIDIAAPTGTPIYAAKSGTVLLASVQGGYGNAVVVDHGDMTTLYGHQSRLAVRAGARVSQGDLLGYVGSTGNSTGPHLHFETRYGGSPRNPRPCLS